MSYSFKNKVFSFIVKYFRFILGAVVVLLLVLSTYLIILPKYKQIADEGYLDYEQKQQTLEAKKNELRELQKLQEELSQITTVEMERLERILPSSKDIPDIFLQMESLARESGLTVSRVSIAETSGRSSNSNSSAAKNSETNVNQAGGIQTITISLSVEGNTTYDSLKILLDNIEDNMRIVDLDSLSYSPPETEGDSSFSVNLATYYLE
ncbi:type 4a pilus biogenesis protein PilO [Patescibacteria group bacterium]|nr:type 4a pilus biogenesis protein PilO [Patescibacteria group bacterium]